MMCLSTGTFTFFLVIYQLKNMQGDLIENTISQSSAQLASDVVSGFVYYMAGARVGFLMTFLTVVAAAGLLLEFPEYT